MIRFTPLTVVCHWSVDWFDFQLFFFFLLLCFSVFLLFTRRRSSYWYLFIRNFTRRRLFPTAYQERKPISAGSSSSPPRPHPRVFFSCLEREMMLHKYSNRYSNFVKNICIFKTDVNQRFCDVTDHRKAKKKNVLLCFITVYLSPWFRNKWHLLLRNLQYV